jgi:glycosyltransferase 2 family protein
MKLDWKSALGVALSVALLWWVLHDENPAEIWHHLRAANPWLMLAAVVVGTTVFPLRARRWRDILAPVDAHVPFGTLWRSTAIGMMVNNVWPARAGELARAYALAKEAPKISFSAAFASLAVDRLFDAIVVILLTLIAAADPAFPRDRGAVSATVGHTVGLGTIAVAVGLTALYGIVFFPQRILAVFELVARRVSPRVADRGRDALLAFAAGLGVLRNPRRFAAVFFWTVVHWLVNALAFWLGFRAVGIDVSFMAALLVQGFIVVAVAVPSAPGFFGVFEAAAKVGLVDVYGVDSGRATAWAIGYHILSFIPITVIGLWYWARLGVRMRDVGGAK